MSSVLTTSTLARAGEAGIHVLVNRLGLQLPDIAAAMHVARSYGHDDDGIDRRKMITVVKDLINRLKIDDDYVTTWLLNQVISTDLSMVKARTYSLLLEEYKNDRVDSDLEMVDVIITLPKFMVETLEKEVKSGTFESVEGAITQATLRMMIDMGLDDDDDDEEE